MDNKKQSVTLDDLASMIKQGFDEVHQKMATKEDLGKLRSDMINYIAKQNLELKTDLVLIMRGEDKKIFSLVELLVEKALITKEDANRVTKLEPFPQTL